MNVIFFFRRKKRRRHRKWEVVIKYICFSRCLILYRISTTVCFALLLVLHLTVNSIIVVYHRFGRGRWSTVSFVIRDSICLMAESKYPSFHQTTQLTLRCFNALFFGRVPFAFIVQSAHFRASTAHCTCLLHCHEQRNREMEIVQSIRGVSSPYSQHKNRVVGVGVAVT